MEPMKRPRLESGMRLLKLKARVALAVATGWYAVGGPRLLAKRALIVVIDAAIGRPPVKGEPNGRKG